MDRELLSVIVLNYNNGDYIFETLESIVNQTYPSIEIIICDDCSSVFEEDRIREWADSHKRPNIKNFLIHRNAENKGTVYNAEKGFEMASGSYVTQIAADDVYYSDDVFETFVDELERLGKDAMIIAGQVAMMNSTLSANNYDFVSDSDKKLIAECTPQQLFEKLSVRCFYPAVNFWRKGLREIVGSLSDHYRMIEDWTESLRLSRMGVRLYYLDVYMMKHRDGGISHGNKNGTSKSYLYYANDNIEAYKREILPYIADFGNDSVKDVIRNYSWWISVIDSPTEGESERPIVAKAVRTVLGKTIDVLRSIYDTVSKKR